METILSMEELTEEHQLRLIVQEVDRLRIEIAALRQDVAPAMAFYRRIEALGWAGRGLLWLVGALLAIGVAVLTALKLLKGP